MTKTGWLARLAACLALIVAMTAISPAAYAQSAHAHTVLKKALEDTRFPIPQADPATGNYAETGNFGTVFYSGSGCNSQIVENYPPMDGKAAYNRTIALDWKKVTVVSVNEEMPGWIAIHTADPDRLEYFYLHSATASHPAIAELQSICAPNSTFSQAKPERAAAIREIKTILDVAQVPLFTSGQRVPGATGRWLVYGGGCTTGIESHLPSYTVGNTTKAADSMVIVHYWDTPIAVSINSANPEYVILQRGGQDTKGSYYAGGASQAQSLKAAFERLSASCMAAGPVASAQPTLEAGTWDGGYSEDEDICVLRFDFSQGGMFALIGAWDGLYLVSSHPRALEILRGSGKIGVSVVSGQTRLDMPDRVNSSATATMLDGYFNTLAEEDKVIAAHSNGAPVTYTFTGSGNRSTHLRLPPADAEPLKRFTDCYL